MKRNKKVKAVMLFFIILGICTMVSCGLHNNKQEPINKDDAVFTIAKFQSGGWGADSARKDNNLTLESMLKYALQDEYLQRARYEYVEKKYRGEKNLTSMMKDENVHVYRMTALLSKYKVNIPPDKSNEYFFKFPKSLEDAYALLVKSESDSLAMYEKFLEQPELPEELKEIFNKQIEESKTHLDILRENMQNKNN